MLDRPLSLSGGGASGQYTSLRTPVSHAISAALRPGRCRFCHFMSACMIAPGVPGFVVIRPDMAGAVEKLS